MEYISNQKVLFISKEELALHKDVQDITDEHLMTRYGEGDFAAFEVLYERHKGGVYRYLSRQVYDESLVDDLFQEVWGKVIKSASSYQATAKFTTWMYTIARHKVIDHIRHLKSVSSYMDNNSNDQASGLNGDTENAVVTREPESVATPEKHITQSQQSEAIAHCMSKLPLHHLDSFLLKEEGGLTAPQIAHIADISIEASKSRLKSAYKLLRECLGRTFGDELDSTRRGAEL